MKKNNKIKKSVSVLAFLFVCAVSVILSSCSDELDIQQSYPFKVETMPVPKDIVRGQTVEIRCELKAEGKFDGTIYTIRYFQHDGKGSLRMENGTVFQPNDRYLLENEKFRLYYTSASTETQTLTVVVEDNFGKSYSIDPCVFKDDDGKIYCYFGGIWGGQLQWYKDNKALKDEHLPEGKENPLPSRVAMMTDDVQQFAEMPKPVVIVDEEGKVLPADDPHRFFEASWMHKYKGKYYFSYSTGDTHYLCYAVGDNPYGPFTYKGVILEPVVGWTTHHSICEYKGQWYLFHHDCVPSNDTTWLRSVKVAPLFYDEDDNILPVQPE